MRATPLFTIVIAAAVALLAAPANAGEHGKSCDKPVQSCLDGMITKLKTSGFIGLELDKDEATKRLTVTSVIAGSPAEQAGIRIGDELHALNGIRFASGDYDAISKVKVPGAEVTCTIKRDGESRNLRLTLVPMPADLMAKYIGEHMMAHAKKGDTAVAGK